ncbi:HlyD family secretion protein [Formivibrio citricus]|uniref:HlyD family secretion protein n=1 Tax=Formivibrio citricus TaxID=83765 RepID=A0A1I5CL35_9NEIS|nr:efflux RND transporter periplasmic adaptor subunit [Formivibrio citricus]SFN87614.1 HlyD family secretion protein [Formivibrio citricus]
MKLPALSSKQLVLIICGVVLLAGFAMVVSRSGPLAPIRVTVVRAETRTLATSLFGIGTIEARRSYFIGPTAAGRVRSIQVDVGDSVKAGQVLAEIDPVDLDERLRSQEAAYTRAQSAVVAADATRKDAQARKELAEINAKRYLDLGEKRFVSPSAVEGKQQEFTSAQAALESAAANLQGSRQELTRLRADLDGLRQQRKNLRLLAPRDGIVTSRDAEPGSTVIAGQSVVKLIEPDSLWVKVRLDQGRSRGLAVGLPAEIALRANPSSKLPGKVLRVEPVSDSVTEERIAFIALDKLPAGLTVGELAEVTLNTAPGEALPTLPNAAIKHTAQGPGVWLLQDGKPVFTRVSLGESSLDGYTQIRAGLNEGAQVIVHREKELSDGARIKVVERLAGSKP